jgi:hypothetical protein
VGSELKTAVIRKTLTIQSEGKEEKENGGHLGKRLAFQTTANHATKEIMRRDWNELNMT